EWYYFTSSLFEIEPGEEEEINPGRVGRQLAHWLKARLEEKGYPVEDIINEDWGRCLMCSRDPFLLWVGCGNMEGDAGWLPDGSALNQEIIWCCFPAAEVFFWKRLFRKIDTAPALAKLRADLGDILRAEP